MSSETKMNTEEMKKSEESFFSNLFQPKTPIIWPNAIFFLIFHIIAFYQFIRFHLIDTWTLLAYRYLYVFVFNQITGLAITAGAHRLWSHRAYRASLPLRMILGLWWTVIGQKKIYDWVRDHRVHHKYTETDADPHDSRRGFFYSHVGWLMMRKHPEVIKRGNEVDMSDVLADPVVQFIDKHFQIMTFIFCYILPNIGPVLLWNESWYNSIMLCTFVRYAVSLNFTWSVNSFAHMFGTKPYDKDIKPAETFLVTFCTMGEGWHNFHHTFPSDYRASEWGKYNPTTVFLHLMEKIGWASDFRTVSDQVIQKAILTTGDNTHKLSREQRWKEYVLEEEEKESEKSL